VATFGGPPEASPSPSPSDAANPGDGIVLENGLPLAAGEGQWLPVGEKVVAREISTRYEVNAGGERVGVAEVDLPDVNADGGDPKTLTFHYMMLVPIEAGLAEGDEVVLESLPDGGYQVTGPDGAELDGPLVIEVLPGGSEE
jgi:hypothetical protein